MHYAGQQTRHNGPPRVQVGIRVLSKAMRTKMANSSPSTAYRPTRFYVCPSLRRAAHHLGVMNPLDNSQDVAREFEDFVAGSGRRSRDKNQHTSKHWVMHNIPKGAISHFANFTSDRFDPLA